MLIKVTENKNIGKYLSEDIPFIFYNETGEQKTPFILRKGMEVELDFSAVKEHIEVESLYELEGVFYCFYDKKMRNGSMLTLCPFKIIEKI